MQARSPCDSASQQQTHLCVPPPVLKSRCAGANLANAWMMRPGGSVIEIIPYQFETGRGSFVFSFSNSWVGAAVQSGRRGLQAGRMG